MNQPSLLSVLRPAYRSNMVICSVHGRSVLAGSLVLAALVMNPMRTLGYANVRVNTNSNQPEETSIAINPRNPDNIMGVAQGSDCYFYPSFDAGQTWTEGSLADPFCLGDPATVFDRNGTAYYCYIGTWSHSGIFANRSTDGGRTWLPQGTAIIQHAGDVPFEDKSYPAADWSTGPSAGNIYVSWTQFTHYGSTNPADSSRILFSRSTDAGTTFSNPQIVSDQGGDAIDSDNTVEGAVPAVGPDGAVYIAWAGPRGIEFDRSAPGGMSFGRDVVISDIPGGWDYSVPGIYRANGLPVIKTDISHGPYRGRVYVNWSDQRNGDTDVFLIYSDDRGLTWSPRIRVNDDPLGNGRDQFFTWMDVDAVTGSVYVVFYDRREHSDNLTTDVYMARSDDGGGHFTNEKISSTPFVPRSDVFFGDYIGVSAFGGRVRPLWMRLDGTTLSLWTALIERPSASIAEETSDRARMTVFPNPTHFSDVSIDLGVRESHITRIEIHDASGRLVRTLDHPGDRGFIWDGKAENGAAAPAGVYFVSADRYQPSRIVIIR